MAARRLGARPGLAAAAAVLPSLGFAAVATVCLLTDALYAALVAGAALRLAAGRGVRAAAVAGAMLALATTLREATPLLACCFAPLAWVAAGGPMPGRRRRPRDGRPSTPAPGAARPDPREAPLGGSRAPGALAGPGQSPGLASLLPPLAVALVLALPWTVAAAQVAWNAGRGAGPVLTTSRQTVMVQAVLPLLRRHPELLAGDGAFERAARPTVGGGEYGGIDPLHDRLFAAGLSAPDMARAASALYARAWRRHPLAMLGATLGNVRHEFLALPFQPVDTVGALMVYAGWPRPEFDRLNLLWARARRGDAAAAGWIALDVLTRLAGTAVSVLALVGPWRRDASWRLRALWCVPVGLAGLYMPVHLETRYLLPAVPLMCVLAACSLAGRGPRGETASEGSALRTSRQGGLASLDPPLGP